MNFVVYSKDGCPYCDKIKMVLDYICKDNQNSLVNYKLGDDFNREDFYSKFGFGSTFPQVVCDDLNIGGCTDTIQYLKESNMF